VVGLGVQPANAVLAPPASKSAAVSTAAPVASPPLMATAGHTRRVRGR
jgi:hypothetical protein